MPVSLDFRGDVGEIGSGWLQLGTWVFASQVDS
jgi:hypothetical protein